MSWRRWLPFANLRYRLECERRLQQVIDFSPAIIFVKDLDGRYSTVNRAFELATGLAREEIVGRRDAELFPAEIAAATQANDAQALRARGPVMSEEVVRGPAGEPCVFLARKAAVRDEQGNPYLLCGAGIDITEQKRLEARRRELAQRVQEVSEHERRALAYELHDRIGQLLAELSIGLERQRETLDSAIRVARDLTAEIGPPDFERTTLLESIGRFAAAAGERYGFAVDVLGEEFRPRLAREAEEALYRIAQEAIANAAKHARAQTVTVELDDTADEARLSVSDDGAGFDARAARGDGFGLQFIRERAEALGARLELESTPGIGTTVAVSVPKSA
jgi:PAS domain S-box-containing protein